MGKALGNAHDMGREHTVVSALAATDVPVAPIAGLLHDDPGVNERALLRDGLGRGPDPAHDADAVSVQRGGARGDRRPRGRARWSRSTPSIPTRSASASSAGRRTTSPASSSAGRASGRGNDARHPAGRGGRQASSSARIPEQGPATIVHGDYRLDNMILHRRRRGRRRRRLGALHPRRPARRRRPADRLLGEGRATS